MQEMARYQIILAYDGTGFLGSQRQAGSRTAQSELEAALRRLGWRGQTVFLAGRTDTGTHASGQVAAFDLDWRHGLADLQEALNAYLPRDMAVQAVNLASDDFHPRFSASFTPVPLPVVLQGCSGIRSGNGMPGAFGLL